MLLATALWGTKPSWLFALIPVVAVLAGKVPAIPLTNPIGCNVKWKGKDHHWMPAEACDLV